MNDAHSRRNPWTCGALSLMCPGFGHVYLGHAERGVLPALGVYLGMWGAGTLGFLASFVGFVGVALIMFALYAVLAVDAFLLARRETVFIPKFYNRIAPYALFALVLIGLPNYLIAERAELLGYDSLEIGSDTMQPTLLIGDSVLVDTGIYTHAEPRVGDVVAFLIPSQEEGKGASVGISRIAGLPGDRIALQDGQVLRNGRVDPGLTVVEANRQEAFSLSMDEQIVPEGSVALLGDWRDRARDSRFNGPYPRLGLIGPVTAIWWSADRDRIGRSLR
ncbi:MAG: signal peptidase I [Gammaproteobacteria bacterium]|nr:signal peptidase I [Gammaproteobacteria bacterium]MCP5136256.1 signal peptidase I [Gammaproteobacteria bacterium]